MMQHRSETEARRTTKYPIYVHTGDEKHAYGVSIPDFPGCYSAADSLDDLPQMIQEAAEVYFEGEELDIPPPSRLEELRHDPQFTGGEWQMVEIDTERLKAVRKR